MNIVTVPKGTKNSLSFYGGCEEFLRSKDHQVFVYGGTGSGKSLRNSEPVLTPHGWSPISKCSVGDKIYSKDGKLCTVVGVYPQGVLEVFRVYFSDGSFVDTSEDHLWEVTTRKIRCKLPTPWTRKHRPNCEDWTCNKPIILTTGQIKDRIDEKIAIPVTVPVSFDEKDLPVHPYLLGCLLGDGGLNDSSLRFSTQDAEILETLRTLLPNGVILKHITKYDYRLSTSPGKRNPLSSLLTNLGLRYTKSDSKFIPSAYLLGSVNQRLELLQGLLDTDGGVSGKNSIEFSTASTQLKNDVVSLVRSLGGVAVVKERHPWYTYKGERKEGKLSYRISIKLPNNLQPFKLSRKLNKLTDRTYTPRRYVVKVEAVGFDECTCIKVDHPSETFLTKDFIVTHNTTAACMKLLMLCLKYPGAKALFTRNSYRALLKSGVETFERVVREVGLEIGKKPHQIRKLGETEPREYRFPMAKRIASDGTVYEGESRILLSSLSRAKEELGAEYDYVYVNQPEQITEEDWQFLVTRANGRRGHVPDPMLFGDPNPEHEQHWIKLGGYQIIDGKRVGDGERWRLIKSVYTDNPVIWDQKLNCFTKSGEDQVGKLLQSLNPVMRKRLIEAEWCSFEGLVYGEVWDRGKHLITTEELAQYNIDERWPRYWAIDFGFNDPFVCSFIAKHPDRELYIRYKLIYMSNRTILEQAETIKAVTLGEPRPTLVVADRNPQEISLLSQALGINIISAKKGAGSVQARIDILTDLLKTNKLLFYNEALVEEDERLLRAKKPIGFEKEVENLRRDEKKGGEKPIDGDDHEENALGYLFCHLKADKRVVPFIWTQ